MCLGPLSGSQSRDNALGLLETGHLLVGARRDPGTCNPGLATAALTALAALATVAYDPLIVLLHQGRAAVHSGLVEAEITKFFFNFLAVSYNDHSNLVKFQQ